MAMHHSWYPARLSVKGTGKNAYLPGHSSLSLERDLVHTLQAAAWGSDFLLAWYWKLATILHGAQGNPVGTSSAFSLQLTPTKKPSSLASLKEACTSLVSQLLHLSPEKQAPRLPGPDSQRGLCSWMSQDYRKQSSSSQWTCKHSPKLSPQGSAQHKQAKMPISHSFTGRGLIAYFTSYRLRVQLLIRTQFGADCDPPWSPKESVGTFSTFSLLLTPTKKPSHWYLSIRSLYTCLAP